MDRIFRSINRKIVERSIIESIDDGSSSQDSTTDSVSEITCYQEDSEDDYDPKTFSKRLRKQDGGVKSVRKISSPSIPLNNLKSRKIERLPTRRPNPKVSNRNALLARENRQKKKEMMEKLEQENNELKVENKKLKKLLKQNGSMINKLGREQQYLKSVIANRTEIMSILKSVQGTRIPITSSIRSFSTNSGSDEGISSGYDFESKDENEMSPASYNNDDFDLNEDFNIFQNNSSTVYGDNVEDILMATATTRQEVINSEHNYFELDNKQKLLEPGVCLHISSGKISLEFCATCHLNSQNAWVEEN